MSYGEVRERPTKKRRFFVDDVDEPAVNPEPSLPDEISSLPAAADGHAASPGFDADSLEAIIGERLSLTDVQKLRDLSGGSLEQGGMDGAN
jgi:hypothetical protein